jgi:hypothetical protein
VTPADKRNVTTRRAILLAAVAILATVANLTAQRPAARTAAVGVLVGVHRTDISQTIATAPRASTLRTLWLGSPGTAVDTVSGLLVPRRSGFWRVDLDSNCAEEPYPDIDGNRLGDKVEIEDQLRAYPVEASTRVEGTRTSSECSSTDVYCSIDRRTRIYWVWPEFISLARGGGYGCGVHPDADYRSAVYRLESLGAPLTVTEMFGRSVENRMKRSFERAKDEDGVVHGADCATEGTFSPISWHVWRQDGQWRFEGWADTHRLCGYGFGYTTPVDLSRFGVSATARPRPASLIPSRDDAVPSPDRRWTLLVRQTEVLLAPSGALDRPVARLPLTGDDDVVMVEWATGANVARWRNEVQRQAVAR